MRIRLETVINWEKRAEKASFRVATLSRDLNVSRRTLHTSIFKEFGCSPRHWLEDLRLRRAIALLDGGMTLKEIAAELSLTPASFSRFFNRNLGCAPGTYPSARQPENTRTSRTIEAADTRDGFPPTVTTGLLWVAPKFFS